MIFVNWPITPKGGGEKSVGDKREEVQGKSVCGEAALRSRWNFDLSVCGR